MNDDSDLNSVNSAGSSNGIRNSDEDTPSFRAYIRDEDGTTDQSGDENDEDQNVSSQEGDLSHNDDEDEDRGHTIKHESDDEDDNKSMDEDTLMKNSKGKSLESTSIDVDNNESDNAGGRDDDDNDDFTYDSPSNDIGQDNEAMDAKDAKQNQNDILEDNQSIINDSFTESSAVIATPLFEDSTEHTPRTRSSEVVAVESAAEPSSQAGANLAAVVIEKVRRRTPPSNQYMRLYCGGGYYGVPPRKYLATKP